MNNKKTHHPNYQHLIPVTQPQNMSKFDQFIEDFDKTLNKDTSTISTLSSPTDPQPPDMDLKPLSPIPPGTPNPQQQHQRTTSQSTPTKPRKNSVSSHPLSPNPSSARKKGLNLNIAMSKNSTPKRVTSGTDMNEVLRKMASSEMKIVELKDELKLLQGRIAREEEELNRLRSKVARNLNNVPKPKKSEELLKEKRENGKENGDGKESYWSKPLTMLNQFDQMLQNEMEKLNKDQKEKDDVLKSVSNSLWSFVSDVKQGLMGDDDQEKILKMKEAQGRKIVDKSIEDESDDEKGKELIDFGDDDDRGKEN